MFRECQACLITKTDLIPHLDVDMALLEKNIRNINADLEILPLAAKYDEGIHRWLEWLMQNLETAGKRVGVKS